MNKDLQTLNKLMNELRDKHIEIYVKMRSKIIEMIEDDNSIFSNDEKIALENIVYRERIHLY